MLQMITQDILSKFVEWFLCLFLFILFIKAYCQQASLYFHYLNLSLLIILANKLIQLLSRSYLRILRITAVTIHNCCSPHIIQNKNSI